MDYFNIKNISRIDFRHRIENTNNFHKTTIIQYNDLKYILYEDEILLVDNYTIYNLIDINDTYIIDIKEGLNKLNENIGDIILNYIILNHPNFIKFI